MYKIKYVTITDSVFHLFFSWWIVYLDNFEIEDYVFVALHDCQNPADRLTQEESAAIHLYTMQFQGGPSLYLLFNQSSRAELKPWFPFLKLFLTALYEWPSKIRNIWRGVKNFDWKFKMQNCSIRKY